MREEPGWPQNYFNYFTEIEEHFRRVRGSSLFLLSPLDWALIENWKNSGVPLEAVLEGIDEVFEKWRSRKIKTRSVNSLAYCAQAVLEAAQRTPASTQRTSAPTSPPFSIDELRAFLERAVNTLLEKPEAAYQGIATTLRAIAAEADRQIHDLEDLERRLSALEDKMVAAVRSMQSDEDLYAIRRDLDRELKPYRGKMTADQIAMLERRYLDSALLERANLPRLSLFYLH